MPGAIARCDERAIKMPAYHRGSVIADYKVASRLVDTFHQSAVRLRTQLSRASNRFTHRLEATSGAACRCQRHTLKARSAWLLSDLRIRNPLVDIDRSRRRHAAHIDGAS
jgi:hypothetical protein